MSNFNNLSVEDRINAIIEAARNSGWDESRERGAITLKQAEQIEQKNLQLVAQGYKQQQDASRNNRNGDSEKARQINLAYEQRSYQLGSID